MLSTNIPKGDNLSHVEIRIYEALTEEEKVKLREMTTGYGKMKACEQATTITRQTLYKAMLGSALRKENAEKIRAYINIK